MSFAPIAEVLEDLRAGKMVVLVDDESRENEGDLLLAAEKATPGAVNFMLTHARGFLCLPVSDGIATKLNLHPMVTPNTCPLGTPFTVTIDAGRGITTGVSVSDRCVTIGRVVAEGARPSDFVRPGHVFPLRAHPGGVRARSGHTEGAIELVTLAGMKPAAVIAEIMNPDGTMAKLPQLRTFARTHGLKMCSIEAILRFLDTGKRTR
jgi:3,4-dihydroxy 2-butanone 4-phosphate synthase/GTP cyclohydrolase II